MVQIDAELSPSDHTFPASPGNSPRSVPPGSEPSAVGTSRLMVFCLVAGILSGTASLLAGEAIMHHYREDLLPPVKYNPSHEEIVRWHNARLYCATASFAAMGGFLGLAMGMAGGLARRSIFRGASAAIMGLLLGTIVAASASVLLVPIFYKKHDPQSGDLIFPMLTHGAIWSLVGAIGGLSFGLAWGTRSLESNFGRRARRRRRRNRRLRDCGRRSPSRSTGRIFRFRPRLRLVRWRNCWLRF